MRWILGVLLSCFYTFMFMNGAIADGPTGIEGKVVNGTTYGGNPEGINVRIRYLSGDGNVIELESRTGPNGEFEFPNISGNSILFYTLETIYLDVPYKIEVDPKQFGGPTELVVYDVMDSFEQLTVLDHSVVVTDADRVNQKLHILEAVKVENPGERTFFIPTNTSNPMNLLRFSLPIGALDLEVESSSGGGHVIQIDLGFALTIPVPPGESEILFTYTAPYKNGIWEYRPAMIRGANTYRFMIKKGIGLLSKGAFAEQGEVNVGNEVYHLFQQENLDVGERLDINVSALPKLKFSDHLSKIVSSRNIFLGVIPGIAGLAFLVLLWIGIYRRKFASR